MFVLAVILSIVLAALLAFSARGKLVRDPNVLKPLQRVGVSGQLTTVLAYLEIVGAVGLLVGIGIEWIGVLAAIGVVLYFLAAIIAHLRVGDRNVVPPAVFLVLAVVVLALRSASA